MTDNASSAANVIQHDFGMAQNNPEMMESLKLSTPRSTNDATTETCNYNSNNQGFVNEFSKHIIERMEDIMANDLYDGHHVLAIESITSAHPVMRLLFRRKFLSTIENISGFLSVNRESCSIDAFFEQIGYYEGQGAVEQTILLHLLGCLETSEPVAILTSLPEKTSKLRWHNQYDLAGCLDKFERWLYLLLSDTFRHNMVRFFKSRRLRRTNYSGGCDGVRNTMKDIDVLIENL